MAGTGAISACGDTTRRESNMWEGSEFVYIVCVCLVFLTRLGGEIFPALTTYVSTGFIILRADTHSILSFFILATKMTRTLESKVKRHLWGSDLWNGINVCTRWCCLFRFRLAEFGKVKWRAYRESFSFLDFGRSARNPNTSPVRVNNCFFPFPFPFSTQHSIIWPHVLPEQHVLYFILFSPVDYVVLLKLLVYRI